MLSQIALSPNQSPVLNNGGWVWDMAILIFALGALVALLVVFGYMRFAPRFQRNEDATRSVRAARIQPGKEALRRPVKVTAAPAPVPAPTVAAVVPVASVAAAVGPEVAALAAVPAAPSAPPAPEAAASAVAAPAMQPATTTGVPDAAAPGVASAPTSAVGAASGATGGGAGAPSERKEVALDQETFDRVLAELLDKGTSRRVAEGQAKRAAMIAARKKAEG